MMPWLLFRIRQVNHDAFDLTCPLCQAAEGTPFFKDQRDYFQCPECSLVFVPPQQFVTLEEEKAVYDLHENSADDPGYRHFLERLFKPLSQHLQANSHGLDFGSGPGPTLSLMFEEEGHSMVNYDYFYAPEIDYLKQRFDFISTTEVVEHLHHPRLELDRLWSCLKPNGLLGIMTKRVLNQAAFSHWHYKSDPTHICFFSLETFQWLADYWHAKLTIHGNDVVIFTRSG